MDLLIINGFQADEKYTRDLDKDVLGRNRTPGAAATAGLTSQA